MDDTYLVTANDRLYKTCPECDHSEPMFILVERGLTTMACCVCSTVLKQVRHVDMEVLIDRLSRA